MFHLFLAHGLGEATDVQVGIPDRGRTGACIGHLGRGSEDSEGAEKLTRLRNVPTSLIHLPSNPGLGLSRWSRPRTAYTVMDTCHPRTRRMEREGQGLKVTLYYMLSSSPAWTTCSLTQRTEQELWQMTPGVNCLTLIPRTSGGGRKLAPKGHPRLPRPSCGVHVPTHMYT